MTGQRVTMADVARRAGVSRTTASFVLANRTDMRISEDAKARVQQAAEELRYRPNLTARSLRTSVTRTIALISDTIATTQFAGEVIHGALDAAMAQDHLLFITETEGDPDVEERLIEGMLDRQVDGFVYAAMFSREVQPPAILREHPVVLLNCVAEGFRAPSVLPDEESAGRVAAQALLDAGHRDGIYVIGGHHAVPETPAGVFAGRERMTGIEMALQNAGTRLAGVAECDWQPEYGYREVRALLASGRRPRAFICSNDRLALGAYQALGEAGLGIPRDVSVVSFDDTDLASWLRPQLTSVALPHYRMGHTAVELLLSGGLDPVVHRIAMPLHARSSHAAADPGSPRSEPVLFLEPVADAASGRRAGA
jgi:LacI family transcriptional regulator